MGRILARTGRAVAKVPLPGRRPAGGRVAEHHVQRRSAAGGRGAEVGQRGDLDVLRARQCIAAARSRHGQADGILAAGGIAMGWVLARARAAVAETPGPTGHRLRRLVGELHAERGGAAGGCAAKGGMRRRVERRNVDGCARGVVSIIRLADAAVGVDDGLDSGLSVKAQRVPVGADLGAAAGRDIVQERAADIPVAPALGRGKEGHSDRATVAAAGVMHAGLHRDHIAFFYVGRAHCRRTGRAGPKRYAVGGQIGGGCGRGLIVIETNGRVRRDIKADGHGDVAALAAEIGVEGGSQVAGSEADGQARGCRIGPVDAAVVADIHRQTVGTAPLPPTVKSRLKLLYVCAGMRTWRSLLAADLTWRLVSKTCAALDT